MSDTAASRQRRYRARRSIGRAVLRLEVEMLPVADWLIEKRFLAAWDADDPQKVSEALKQFVAYHSRYA